MSNAVIVKTRKFKRNPLLARKQVCLPLCCWNVDERDVLTFVVPTYWKVYAVSGYLCISTFVLWIMIAMDPETLF
jgi:hypothetical protein